VRSQFILSEIGIGLRRNLLLTIAVIVVTAMSLLAVGASLLFGKQVGLMKGYWYDKVEVTVYLCIDNDPSTNCPRPATNVDRDAISAALSANPAVQKVYYESQAEAFAEFKILFKDSPEIVKNVKPESLPDSYRVKLKNPDNVAVIASDMQGRPGVSEVQDVKKSLAPIFTLLNGLRRSTEVLAGIALVAASLLVFVTITVAAFSRRRETGIMRLVGASNLYIRAPFLLEGAIAGIVGAGIACVALGAAKVLLVDGVLKSTIKFTPFVAWGDFYGVFWKLAVIGALMSTLSSFLAIQRHLRV
jgi:cell division transport system permease protein